MTKYEIAENYKNLREKAFDVKPIEELNLAKTGGNIVYGVIMETGYPKAVASLIAFGEGSVSLYFSNGGGLIGIGEYKKPRKICLDYIREANDFIEHSVLTTDYSLPQNGETIFYLLTHRGVFKFKDSEDNLANGRSKLSKIFFKAQALLTEARLIEESRMEKK